MEQRGSAPVRADAPLGPAPHPVRAAAPAAPAADATARAGLERAGDPAQQTTAALVDLVDGWQRQIDSAAVQLWRCVAELQHRQAPSGAPLPDRDAVLHEVALATRSGLGSAQFLLRQGWSLTRGPLRALGAAVAGGALSRSQALRVWDTWSDEPPAVQRAAAERLAQAAASTPHGLTADRFSAVARAALLSARRGQGLPAAPEARVARTRRCVRHYPTPDGLGVIAVVLPAERAETLHRRLTAAARALPADDPRSRQQREADLAADALDAGLQQLAGPCEQHGTPPRTEVLIHLDTLTGLDDAPARLSDGTVIDAALARSLATEGPWRLTGLDDHGTPRATTRWQPGTPPPTTLADLHPRLDNPADDELGDDVTDRVCARPPSAVEPPPQPVPGPQPRPVAAGGSARGAAAAVRAALRDDPYRLNTAAPDLRAWVDERVTRLARELRQQPLPLGDSAVQTALPWAPTPDAWPDASPHALPDGPDVAPPHHPRQPRQPRQPLTDRLLLRDGVCQFPGCRRPGRLCDIEHAVPWGVPGGGTDAVNCYLLCRRHHRVKDSTDWVVQRLDERTTRWVSPAGRSYLHGPPATDWTHRPDLGARNWPALSELPAAPAPRGGRRPYFVGLHVRRAPPLRT